MPRGQQFGYMFVKGKEGDEQGLTAAHEIGHGIFQLQHAFEYSGIKQKAIFLRWRGSVGPVPTEMLRPKKVKENNFRKMKLAQIYKMSHT